jgi:hydrogenase assembly chaperone HypC/HupF
MCLTVPCQVIRVQGQTATVARGGETLDVSLAFLDEPVGAGDWIAVQAQRHAFARLTAEEARELLDLYEHISQVIDQSERADAAP